MSNVPIVFVVEDDLAVQDALSRLIKSLNLQVESFTSAEEFLEQANLAQAGCMVLDICLPGLDGLTLHERLAENGTRLPVIMISGHADIRVSVRSMKLGAVDFLEKPYRSRELRGAIQRALEIDETRRENAVRREHCMRLIATLSQQEQTILHRIALGKTNGDIALELDVSLRTVQFRRSSLCRKLNASSREDLIRFATEASLLTDFQHFGS